MIKNNKTIFLILLLLLLPFCGANEEQVVKKINNCFKLADAVEDVFDTIQIEAYESEVYKTYSGIDPTKLDYINEALRINKIGLDGLDEVLKNYEINNKNIESLIEGFYNNFLDSKEANLALEKHLISINNQWTIQEEVKWWEENKQYSILNWRTSDEYLQLMSDKSQNTLNPDPDFVVSDSYPKNIVRLYCDNV